MFSQLGPLFKTTFRQAESNDTRQHIPHQEMHKHKRKNPDEREKQSDDTLWQDNTSVSVTALRTFLIDFLKTIPEAKDISFVKQDKSDDSLKVRPHEKSRPTNTHNAKAVRAYQTMANHSESKKTNPHNTPPKINNDPTADKIQSQELRDIYALIQNLEIIQERGVQNLTIQKADSFVESLKNAVKIALSKI